MTVTVPVERETSVLQETPAPTSLLGRMQVVDTLRSVLGDVVPDERLAAAAEALQRAELEQWEALPPEIHPEMGFNYHFLACSETCWLGRQVLIDGATFRVYRKR